LFPCITASLNIIYFSKLDNIFFREEDAGKNAALIKISLNEEEITLYHFISFCQIVFENCFENSMIQPV